MSAYPGRDPTIMPCRWEDPIHCSHPVRISGNISSRTDDGILHQSSAYPLWGQAKLLCHTIGFSFLDEDARSKLVAAIYRGDGMIDDDPGPILWHRSMPLCAVIFFFARPLRLPELFTAISDNVVVFLAFKALHASPLITGSFYDIAATVALSAPYGGR
ncbi:unnamed protein product [Periconia digitata]|uniref:Uncharacterized protein n=1 Tax=Periconia digitata TaxID=1303443 RepID=A0A9W4UHB7_9PLEO|nr:unnamed protein product [Periconia digitata]